MNILTVYRAAFDIDDTTDKRGDLLKFCDGVARLTRAKKYKAIDTSDTAGGPAWAAYMVITCDDRATLADFLARLPRMARGARVTLQDWNG